MISPGARSRVVKRPACLQAGCEGVVMGVMRTLVCDPERRVFGKDGTASDVGGRVRIALRCVGVREGE
jgi:hypothetical protein